MENPEKIVIGTCMFIAGFIACLFAVALSNTPMEGIEMPKSITGLSSADSNAPGDWINTKQIRITENSVIIMVKNASISKYADTGSMKPTLDSDSNGIRVVPSSPEQIKVGDIVTFSLNGENIVHRVIEKGEDDLGYWFLTKGDNNPSSDGMKIRFEDVRYVTIGVLW